MDDLPPKLYTVPVRNVMMPIVEHHVSIMYFCVDLYFSHKLDDLLLESTRCCGFDSLCTIQLFLYPLICWLFVHVFRSSLWTRVIATPQTC